MYNDYVNADFLPEPQSTTPTNFLDLDGAVWSSTTGLSDFPVGDFATNYIVTYTTNTTTVTTETTWNQISATFAGNTSSKWIQEAVDLSAYAGETVQLAFHFGSASGTVAIGWYVDDLSIDAAPTLMVPTNQVINFGQQFTNILTATNTIEPNSIFTFALAEASTNAIVKTNGLVIWTNTVAPPGTYNISAQVTDNSSPPLSDTNSFSVTVLPLSSQLILTNVAFVTNGGHSFRFNIKTHWTNNPGLIVATTNLRFQHKLVSDLYQSSHSRRHSAIHRPTGHKFHTALLPRGVSVINGSNNATSAIAEFFGVWKGFVSPFIEPP